MSIPNTIYQPDFETPPTEPAVPAWKVELNAKLAAHRQRRPSSGLTGSETAAQANSQRGGPPPPGNGSARAAKVAARVAERYAKAPSYSEYLAASAAAAAAAAETAAFAMRQAQEAAEVFARLSANENASPAECDLRQAWGPRGVTENDGFSLNETPAEDRRVRVEHPEPLPPRGVVPPRQTGSAPGPWNNGSQIVDALAEATVPAAVSLPAKLIQFPRELIAARKSRPRVAEGPLAESSPIAEPDAASLRIFEVEGLGMGGEQGLNRIQASSSSAEGTHDAPSLSAGREGRSGEPVPLGERQGGRFIPSGSSYRAHDDRPVDEADRGAPEWQSIRLGEHPAGERQADWPAGDRALASGDYDLRLRLPILHTASLGDRTMAALVDVAAVGGAFLVFVLVFALCTAHPPVDKAAFVSAAFILAGLFLFYEWLFMSYGGGTPGMRYARIALCTFDDENPTRKVLQRRVLASLLSALPLGLGFLWALFDEDSLGWHDRMSQSYQRSYR